MAEGNPYSFLHVDKPEIDLPEDTDPYSEQVYQKGRDNLERFISKGWLQQDKESRYYIYSQAFKGQAAQYGLVAASSIEDYESNRIKKHEKTLKRKEEDRTRLTDIQGANIGPVFLTYQRGDAIQEKVADIVMKVEPY